MVESKRYGLDALRALMGWRNATPRFDLIGSPEVEQDENDIGLAFLQIKADGIYVVPPEGWNSYDLSIITGDRDSMWLQGRPMLPLPFAIEELRRVEAGALGIMEQLLRGESTEAEIDRLARNSSDAAEIARALVSDFDDQQGREEVEVQETPTQRQDRRLARLRKLGGNYVKHGDAWATSRKDGHLAALILEEKNAGRPMSDKTNVRRDLAAAAAREMAGNR